MVKRNSKFTDGFRKDVYGKSIHNLIENLIEYIITTEKFFLSKEEFKFVVDMSIYEITKKYKLSSNNKFINKIYGDLWGFYKTEYKRFVREFRNILKSKKLSLKNLIVETEKTFLFESVKIEIIDNFEIKRIQTQRIIEPDVLLKTRNDRYISIIEIKSKLKINDVNFLKKLIRQVLSYFELLKHNNKFENYKIKEVIVYSIKENSFIVFTEKDYLSFIKNGNSFFIEKLNGKI